MGKKLIAASAALMAMVISLAGFAGEKEVAAGLKGKIIGAETAQIQPAPVPGMFEVVANHQIYYVTGDGRYLFQGHAFDLKEGVDLTEPRVMDVRADAINSVKEDQAITFRPKDVEVKDRITVFTDIDCGFCNKMHQQMDGYLAQGIEIRYLFYPRHGLNAAGARKAEAVWCADDQQSAMNAANADARNMTGVEMRRCENPVAAHYKLGKDVGVRATPTLVTDKGQIIPGYRKPEELRKILDTL